MNAWQAVIFGIVEGLTEFLPVSSTGHLILTARLLGLPQSEYMKSFEIAIQLGAMAAVLSVYGRTVLTDMKMLKRVLVAFLPTAVLGFLLYGFVKRVLLSSETTVLVSLFLGGLVLVLFDRWHREGDDAIDEPRETPYRKAFWVGVVQAFSMIPGVSRSAATVVGGLVVGFKRKAIVEFSFFLAVPTLFAATALDLWKSRTSFANAEWELLLLGSAVSFAVALASIRFFLHYIQHHGFAVFGIYRMILAVVFWIFVR